MRHFDYKCSVAPDQHKMLFRSVNIPAAIARGIPGRGRVMVEHQQIAHLWQYRQPWVRQGNPQV
jgi:hypothetical protein